MRPHQFFVSHPKALVAAAGIVCFSHLGYCRLGENETQLAQRYGTGNAPHKNAVAQGVMPNNRFYKAQGYEITVVLDNKGQSRSESFSAKGEKISKEAIRTLLEANKGKSEWEENNSVDDCPAGATAPRQCWHTKDGTRTAALINSDEGGDKLWILLQEVKPAPKGF